MCLGLLDQASVVVCAPAGQWEPRALTTAWPPVVVVWLVDLLAPGGTSLDVLLPDDQEQQQQQQVPGFARRGQSRGEENQSGFARQTGGRL